MTRTAALTRVAHHGETFVLRSWRSERPSKTALVIHHGLGEHGGRYETFVRHLGELPLHVVAFDLRGHGESSGARGHADGLAALARDFHTLLPGMLAEVGADRAFVLGHSLGAAAVLTWLTEPGLGATGAVQGIWLSAPPVVVPRTLPIRIKARLGRVLKRLRPSFAMSSGIGADGISSDPAEVRRYLEDPFVHDRVSAGLGMSILDDGPRLVERARRITLPALVWQGSEDRIAHPDGARAVFESLASNDKTLHVFEGYRHECHHETPDRVDALFGKLRTWLGLRL